LTLLVPGILANHQDFAMTPDDFATFTDPLDA